MNLHYPAEGYFSLTRLLIILILLFSVNAEAATWYVRHDGGDETACTGLADAAYDGAGSGEACAYNHPSYALGTHANCGNDSRRMASGDTLIINDQTGAGYTTGCGVGDFSSCASVGSGATECTYLPVIDGTAGNPTEIYGSNYASCSADSSKAELWGKEKAYSVLSLTSSDYVDVQCLEITDHVACSQTTYDQGCDNSYPFGDWAQYGIRSYNMKNSTLTNLNIHGLATYAIIGELWGGNALTNVKAVGNSYGGIILDNDTTSGNAQDPGAGAITMTGLTVNWNGCIESYPASTYSHCTSQDQGNYGDGFGAEKMYGTINISDSVLSFNSSDGWDALYGRGESSSSTVERVYAEGNAGNQIKTGQKNTKIENSVAIGNCGFFSQNGYATTRSQDDPRIGGKSNCNCGTDSSQSQAAQQASCNARDYCKWITTGQTHCESNGQADFTGSGVDDMTSSGTFTGDRTTSPTWTIKVSDATTNPDKYQWKKGSGSYSSDVSMTACPTTTSLGEGVSVCWTLVDGHTLNDQWTITVIGCAFNDCRSGGDALAIDIRTGGTVEVYNSTVLTQGNYAIFVERPLYMPACNGTEQITLTNILAQGQTKYAGGGLPNYQATSTCTGATTTKKNTVAYNFVSNPSGTNMSYANPQLVGPLGSTQSYNVHLTSASTNAIDDADETANVNNTNDYDNVSRGASWDIGAYEYEADVVAPICGNGTIESGEECDDSNTTQCDGCSASCQTEECGNGLIECTEECDDGNVTSGDGCSDVCVSTPVCGNGTVEAGEQCDDSNTTACDSCSATCKNELCGNGVTECGELCDGTPDCGSDCKYVQIKFIMNVDISVPPLPKTAVIEGTIQFKGQ